MELQGLYELHDRLTAAAVVGASLAAEDFRLKRAVEQIRPMAEAVPVIKKLYFMTEKILSPDCEDRAGCLLDTLALSKAVLCTQAGCGGEADAEYCEPELAPRSHGLCLPYSQVAPFENAMTKARKERRIAITDIRKKPKLFDDYRLQAAMVLALSDEYHIVAWAAYEFLSGAERGFFRGDRLEAVVLSAYQSGPGAELFLARDRNNLSLLKKGFWETTARGRRLRLEVIAAIAGGEENNFYLELLDRGEKGVRREAIRALHFEASNAGVLLELAKTEEGDCLAMTERVLGIMEGEAVTEYWKTQLKKRPKEFVHYLRFSKLDEVSDAIAGLINEASAVPVSEEKQRNKAKTDAEKEWESWRDALISAMPGKGSGAMQEIYRNAASGNVFNGKMQSRMVEALLKSIIYSVDERLMALAYELADHYDRSWIGPALAADFLTQPAGKVYEHCRDELSKASLLGTDEQRKARKSVLAVLGRINESADGNSYELDYEEMVHWWRDKHIVRPLKEMLDPRWFDLLMDETVFGDETVMDVRIVDERYIDQKLNRDLVLFSLVPLKHRMKMEPYFRTRAMQVKDNWECCVILELCGSSDFSGLVVEYVRKNADMGVSLNFINKHFSRMHCWSGWAQEIREIDRFLCGFPENSPQRKKWDSNDSLRHRINRAAGID